ncbi:hypothetical protein N0V94_008550 [Neodidymelliopsis sp. IMI 364377]|nr:hypothetical protein N0V94_008550 [Neodidymelliopsis sp. IMI 364377]
MGNSGSILPWDDWIYHVGDLKNEANDLHNQATSLQDDIRARIIQYNTLLDQAKQLLSANAALVIIARAITFSDLQLKDFETELQTMPDPPEGCVPAKFGAFLSEITGSVLVLKSVVNLAKIAKASWFSGGAEAGGEASAELGVEGLAETGVELGVETGVEAGVEAGVEIGVEAGAEAALAETGIGIIAAVGLDVIFGAINGAQERDQLQSQIDKLNEALGKLRVFQTNLNNKFGKLNGTIIEEETRFKGIVKALHDIIPSNSSGAWESLPIDSSVVSQYLDAQVAALTFYGLLSQLRITYLRAKERAPTASKEAIISAVLMSAKADVSHEQLEGLWDILQQYSDGMKDVTA